MIWTVTIVGAIAIGVIAAFIVSGSFGSKAFGALIGMGTLVAVLAAATIFSLSATPKPIMGFSHAQLEADRVMTQQMSVAVDQGMEVQMAQNSMLQRSADPAYVRALEEHVREFDSAIGQVP